MPDLCDFIPNHRRDIGSGRELIPIPVAVIVARYKGAMTWSGPTIDPP
jgi:hypothetical protein